MGDVPEPVPIWCATRGAVGIGAVDPVTAPLQSLVWGFGRVAALEHPDLWSGLIDLPAAPAEGSARDLAAALVRDDHEDQLALRGSGLFGRRFGHAPATRRRRATAGGNRPKAPC